MSDKTLRKLKVAFARVILMFPNIYIFGFVLCRMFFRICYISAANLISRITCLI